MSQTSLDADRALKSRHRAMWALGDYPAVAAEVIPDLGPELVMAADVQAADHVLDVAAGSGNVAIPAARAGAHVVACDLAPEMFEAGQRSAHEQGVHVLWHEADAEALPFDDDSFDRVLSCVGVMFAPHHRAAADELVRVCRPGGTIGLISWTPDGFIGRMFSTMRPYVAPPPDGVLPPPLWGDEKHVLALLGDRVVDVYTERCLLPVDRFASGEEFRDFFKACYGPTIAAYTGLGDDHRRIAMLDEELAALGRDALTAGRMEWEYLLLTARRR